MSIDLWPHQTAALQATHGAINRGVPAGLVVQPTGTGKTTVFCTLSRDLGWPTLALVHRDELVRQAVDRFSDIWPEATVGIIKAERDEWRDGQRVVVASVQSLHSRRLDTMPQDRFGLVIADEAHHAVADSWRAAIGHFAARFLFGCTATPERTDGRGLADLFGRQPLFSYPLRQAIEDEVLCRLRQYAVDTGTDLDDVGTCYGDFAEGQLSRAVDTPSRNRVIAEAFQEHAAERRALAFAVGVQHAEHIAQAFTQAGIEAACVTGNTPVEERRELLADFAAGRLRVLANCMVLTEGFDDPGIDCVLMARPTKSRSLYTQAVGRGLRRADGKTDCMILDFVDNSSKHKLVTVLDLLGAPKATNAGGRYVVEVADEDRERAEREHAIASARPLQWRLKSVCPWPELPSLRGYVASWPWQREPASEKQAAYLRSFGVEIGRNLTKGESCYLIDRAREFEATYPTPATAKQVWFLRQAGLWREGMTKREATALIGELKREQRVA